MGDILYYERELDSKIIVILSSICNQQAASTEDTAAAVHQLLDYVATYPNDGIAYRDSDMILNGYSDASYLKKSKARSQSGAHILLS